MHDNLKRYDLSSIPPIEGLLSPMHATLPRTLTLGMLCILCLLLISGWTPFDRATWLLEVFPVMVALPLLWLTYQRFPLTPLVYVLIACHAVILIVGGTYSYARVPLGFELQSWLALSRNPYDKIGHFFQGLVPAMIAREILLRGAYIQRGKMLVFVVLCIVLAISASYELLEWLAALLMGQGADEFLGTQGDVWDTQSDMFCAWLGSVTALWLFSTWHDRQLQALAHPSCCASD